MIEYVTLIIQIYVFIKNDLLKLKKHDAELRLIYAQFCLGCFRLQDGVYARNH